MIELKRLNGTPLVLNAELIRSVEPTPDTLITLTTGEKILVQDEVEKVVQKALHYQNAVRQPQGARP